MAIGNTFRYDMLSPDKKYYTLDFNKGAEGSYAPFMPGTQNAPGANIFDLTSAPETIQVGGDTLYKGEGGYGLTNPNAMQPINDVPVEEPPSVEPSPVVPKQEFTTPLLQKSEATIPHFEPANVSLPVLDMSSFDTGLTNTINQRATEGFQYTPEQLANFLDPMERQFDISAKESMDDFMETMNRSGILDSTVATDYGGRLLRNLERERQDAYSTLAGQLIPFQEEANQSRIAQATSRESDIKNLETTKAQLDMQRYQLINQINQGNFSTGLQAAQAQMQLDQLNQQADQINANIELARADSYRGDANLQLAVDQLGLNRSQLEDEINRAGQSQEFGQNITKLQTLLSAWDRLYGQYMDETDRELGADQSIEEIIQQLLAGL